MTESSLEASPEGLKLENSTPPTRVEQRYTVWQAIRHNWGFIGLHASVLAAFFVGVSWPALVACLGFYWMRVFFIWASRRGPCGGLGITASTIGTPTMNRTCTHR